MEDAYSWAALIWKIIMCHEKVKKVSLPILIFNAKVIVFYDFKQNSYL